MIPSAHVQEWSSKALVGLRQVEQDLIICRALCDLFKLSSSSGKNCLSRWHSD